MRISLLTLLTWFSFAAWVMGISQVPQEYRSMAVMATFMVLFVTVGIIAFASPTRNGQLDVDSNPIFRILESAVSLALILLAVCAIGVLGLFLFLMHSIFTW